MSIYRERFQATIEHKPVDRCPIDLGGTPQSTIDSPDLEMALTELIGFQGEPPEDYGKFDRRILKHFDIDFRRCGDLVSFDTDWSRQVSKSEIVDCFGIRRRFTGLYWEIVEYPLQGASRDDIFRYEFPKIHQAPDECWDWWATQAQMLNENTPYVVVGEHPVYGVLEMACWLCGYDHIMLMLALDPEFIHLLFSKILEFQKSVIKEYYGRMGKYIHITTSGDDFGTQTGPFMSAQMWQEFVKPYMRERIEYIARFTDAVYMHHSCGSIFHIIPDLIEIGVRVLNPIQPNATGMDPVLLRETYGEQITFHGGLDTQQVLPSGNFTKIEAAVSNLITTMCPQQRGGYIFAAAHNLQGDIPPGAVACMYRAAHAVQQVGFRYCKQK